MGSPARAGPLPHRCRPLPGDAGLPDPRRLPATVGLRLCACDADEAAREFGAYDGIQAGIDAHRYWETRRLDAIDKGGSTYLKGKLTITMP